VAGTVLQVLVLTAGDTEIGMKSSVATANKVPNTYTGINWNGIRRDSAFDLDDDVLLPELPFLVVCCSW